VLRPSAADGIDVLLYEILSRGKLVRLEAVGMLHMDMGS